MKEVGKNCWPVYSCRCAAEHSWKESDTQMTGYDGVLKEGIEDSQDCENAYSNGGDARSPVNPGREASFLIIGHCRSEDEVFAAGGTLVRFEMVVAGFCDY